MSVVARHLTIFGRVQGVNYRNWMVAAARDLGVAGWVRNRIDGSVEAHIEGEGQAVDRMIQRAHAGPAAAKVVRIEIMDTPPELLDRFERRPTA